MRDKDHTLPGLLGGDEGFELGDGVSDAWNPLRLDIGVRNPGEARDDMFDLYDPRFPFLSPRSREPDVRVDEGAERGARPGRHGGHIDYAALRRVQTS